MIEDFKIRNGDVKKCDHRYASPTTSLLFLKTDFMVTPMVIPAVCKECGRSFEFMKNEMTDRWVNVKSDTSNRKKKGGSR